MIRCILLLSAIFISCDRDEITTDDAAEAGAAPEVGASAEAVADSHLHVVGHFPPRRSTAIRRWCRSSSRASRMRRRQIGRCASEIGFLNGAARKFLIAQGMLLPFSGSCHNQWRARNHSACTGNEKCDHPPRSFAGDRARKSCPRRAPTRRCAADAARRGYELVVVVAGINRVRDGEVADIVEAL